MTNTIINAYLVSDSSGETVLSVSRAAFAQFEKLAVVENIRPLVRSQDHIDKLVAELAALKRDELCIVLYTMLNAELRHYLRNQCQALGIPCVSAISRVVSEIGAVMGMEAITEGTPGKHRMLDKDYYNKIDVINFTIQHDDGSCRDDYNDADILLLGVSRTSKSPTSLYLAQRGYRVANLPIIQDIPVDLSKLTKPLIIGLTIHPETLNHIRTNRILSLDHSSGANNYKRADHYTNIKNIYEELEYANQIFTNYKIPIIDVSRKAIEEIVAEIINLYLFKRGDRPDVYSNR